MDIAPIDVHILSGHELDYWVAQARGLALEKYNFGWRIRDENRDVVGYIGDQPTFITRYHPSINWAQGGQLIEDMEIDVNRVDDPLGKYQGYIFKIMDKENETGDYVTAYGETRLIAAMRTFVASEFSV